MYVTLSLINLSLLVNLATQIRREGDIAILVSQNGEVHQNKNGKTSRVERGATAYGGFLWANAIVPYTISSSFSCEYRRHAWNWSRLVKYNLLMFLFLNSVR